MDACIQASDANLQLPDGSVALVVTSPPYFAGKEYEDLSQNNGASPGTFDAYLDMLRAVFAQCYRKMEPGGRIAVNVANLGRKPYRSLSAEVIHILLQERFLLRAEIIWVKARGQAGSCAWGSFRSPANPVIRDVTERIIVASKERFDRALSAKARQEKGLPFTVTMNKDAFLAHTLDVWEFPPEQATRVGHPAPFPIELPRRLIELYTYENDLVLDPFMGVGTTALAALQTGRRFAGFDTDPSYVEKAERRIQEAMQRVAVSQMRKASIQPSSRHNAVLAKPPPVTAESFLRETAKQGLSAKEWGQALVQWCGFEIVQENRKIPRLGIEVSFELADKKDNRYLADVVGTFEGQRTGLARTDMLWAALGKASVIHAHARAHAARNAKVLPYILLATQKPVARSTGEKVLKQVLGPDRPVACVVDMTKAEDCLWLKDLGQGCDPSLTCDASLPLQA